MTAFLATALAGLGLGLSLIVAIGAQNAFVLRQGIRSEHVLTIVVICIVSDAVLMLAGIGGLGFVVTRAPVVLTIVRIVGGLFLIGYGLLAVRRAVRGEALVTDRTDGQDAARRASGEGATGGATATEGANSGAVAVAVAVAVRAKPRLTLRGAVLTALALTWLNPSVYIDTVLLVGSVANTHGPDGRWSFGAGAVLASTLWFVGVGFGARLLGPLFSRPSSWRVLDAAIALIMFALGTKMLIGF